MELNQVLNQFGNFTISEVSFYNPKVAHIGLGVSVNTGTMQISMSKSTDPNFSGRPEKGQQLYDHKNKVFFGLSPVECSFITRNMQALMNGTFKNPNAKEAKFPNAITITHFRENKPSKLILERATDREGNATGSLKITVFPPPGEPGVITSYVLRADELVVFTNFVKHCAIDLPYHISLTKAISKALNKAIFDQNEYAKKNPSAGGNKNYTAAAAKPANPTFEDTPEDNEATEYDANSTDDMFGFTE